MRILKAFAFVAVAGTLVAGSLQASPPPTGTGMFFWSGTTGGSYCYASNRPFTGTECTNPSPYRGKFTVNSGSYTVPRWMLPVSNTVMDIFCLDFYRNAVTGTYPVYFTNLGDGTAAQVQSNLTGYTHSGGMGTSTLTDYLAAAYLAGQIEALGVPGHGTPTVADMSGAIWEVMSGGFDFTRGGVDTNIDTYVAAAYANASSMNAKEWVVASAGRGDYSQDWLVHVTPEPATLLLLGTGLLATLMAAGALRRTGV